MDIHRQPQRSLNPPNHGISKANLRRYPELSQMPAFWPQSGKSVTFLGFAVYCEPPVKVRNLIFCMSSGVIGCFILALEIFYQSGDEVS
jgi:hypothetical protein